MVAQLSGMKVATSVVKLLEYDKWDTDNSLILKITCEKNQISKLKLDNCMDVKMTIVARFEPSTMFIQLNRMLTTKAVKFLKKPKTRLTEKGKS